MIHTNTTRAKQFWSLLSKLTHCRDYGHCEEEALSKTPVRIIKIFSSWADPPVQYVIYKILKIFLGDSWILCNEFLLPDLYPSLDIFLHPLLQAGEEGAAPHQVSYVSYNIQW